MTARRAIIREADLRRWARVSREEGVAFRGHVDPNGGFTFALDPFPKASRDVDDDLDDRLAKFAGS